MLNFLRLPHQITGRQFQKEFWGSCRVKFFFILCVSAATLAAQGSSDNSSGARTSFSPLTAAGQFFDGDFVNVFAFGNGVWDSRVPTLNSSGQEVFGSGFGWEAGGGITAERKFKDGSVSVNYRGSYRDYQTSSSGSGQQQSLTLAYNKTLSRHWTLRTDIVGGILTSGSSFYSGTALASSTPGNPFSIESRFANASASLTYAQTHRLSYVFTGSFLYSGYVGIKNASGSQLNAPVDTRGVTGGASILYRVTARTTVGGTYTRSYYRYTGNAGTTNVDSAALTFSHLFPNRWQLDLSAGVNRSASVGTTFTYVELPIFGLASCYCHYDRTINSPAFQGVLSHYYRHSSFSVAGGQSIMAGNGLFLASRNQFANGTFSASTRRMNFSLGGTYSRLSSVSAADLSKTYSYYGASAGYGINLMRFVSANLRWDLLHYDNVFGITSATGTVNPTEDRLSFGLSISSRSVPLTLF